MNKPHARLYDEEMTVRALRWRRPRLVWAMLGWCAAGVAFAVAGVLLPDWVFYCAYGCGGMAGVAFLRLLRVQRRLEEIDR